jgi:O-antigen/teichoic acid export membrane protein
MFARIAKNTLITAVSFIFTGFVPLLLVPLLVDRYGMAQYGLMVLARLLLPTGALGFLDLGNSEIAGYAVARARHDGDWRACGRLLSGLLRVNLALGITAALLMFVMAPTLARLFGVEDAQHRGFLLIVRTTAVTLPILLVSLAGEGVLRGFENFRSLRTIEISTVLIFAGMAYAAVKFALGFVWVANAYVAYALIRALGVLWKAHRMLCRDGFGLRSAPIGPEWQELRSRCLALGANRLIGVGQAHASPILIGALIGPRAVGLFDVVVRIPRFLKIVTGVLNTAILPVVMRLDQKNDKDSVRRLFDLGLLGVLCLVAPIVAWCIAFSETILRLWVSEGFRAYWPWQALMFLWPLINAITSFTCGSLLGRNNFVRALNWIVLGQIFAQIVLSMLGMRLFAEQGFIVGQIAALSLSFPFQIALVFRHSGIRITTYRRHFQLLAGCSLFSVAIIASDIPAAVNHPLVLVATLIVWEFAASLGIWIAFLSPKERSAILEMITSTVRRRCGVITHEH